MLARGFTSVRDCGGADFGLARAIDEGHLAGPRMFFGGKALSQTGGHGDMRGRARQVQDLHPCCPNIATVCDGVDEVRRSARDQFRTGANHLKIMLSGGVASPTDAIESTQFSVAEIRAAVEEAEAVGAYVAGHAYTARAINRGLRAGVRTIEHGNLLDDESLSLFLENDAFLVPTLVTYDRLAQEGLENGLPAESMEKVSLVYEAGLSALEAAHRAGVNIAYGSDLLGGMQRYQLSEFRLRTQVQSPMDVIRSATTVAARLVGQPDDLGRVAVGAHADLLLVDADPTDNIDVLVDSARHVKVIMKAGQVVVERS